MEVPPDGLRTSAQFHARILAWSLDHEISQPTVVHSRRRRFPVRRHPDRTGRSAATPAAIDHVGCPTSSGNRPDALGADARASSAADVHGTGYYTDAACRNDACQRADTPYATGRPGSGVPVTKSL